MKRFVIVLSLVSMFAGAALAHDISTYADESATECVLRNVLPPPSMNSVYIIQKFNTGSTASQFRVVDTSTMLLVSAISPYLIVGAYNTDLSVAYLGCVVGQHVLVTLNYFWFGNPLTCENYLRTAAAPASPIPGEIAVADCALPTPNVVSASGGTLFFGPGGDSCPGILCGINPVSESTWGGVKALYR